MTTIPKQYEAQTVEARLQQFWAEQRVYEFVQDERPVYAIDTPPPTVSGHLHLGHVYSYSQAEFMARFWRMRGYNVYYPMGYDDNGLATERLVEQRRRIRVHGPATQEVIGDYSGAVEGSAGFRRVRGLKSLRLATSTRAAPHSHV